MRANSCPGETYPYEEAKKTAKMCSYSRIVRQLKPALQLRLRFIAQVENCKFVAGLNLTNVVGADQA